MEPAFIEETIPEENNHQPELVLDVDGYTTAIPKAKRVVYQCI